MSRSFSFSFSFSPFLPSFFFFLRWYFLLWEISRACSDSPHELIEAKIPSLGLNMSIVHASSGFVSPVPFSSAAPHGSRGYDPCADRNH